MKIYLGILGDPAKIEFYSEEFYEILDWDESQSAFYLIGASERGVTKKHYQEMYDKIKIHTKKKRGYSSIPHLTEDLSDHFSSRIGLFPSSASHLINGPEFTFAPYPINSKSRWLKIKSKVLTYIVSPFVKTKIVPLAYHPLGGKAAKRTEADIEVDEEKISRRFREARKSPYFKWHYLEGGSGENFLGAERIQRIMKGIVPNTENNQVLEKMIYGGGIVHPKQINEIIFSDNEKNIIPQVIVIGNISEQNTKETYKILEKVVEYNKYCQRV